MTWEPEQAIDEFPEIFAARNFTIPQRNLVPTGWSLETGFLYNQLDLRGGAKTEHGVFIHEGVTGLQNHLVNLPFRRDEARIAAAKAACVAAWIQRQPGTSIAALRFRAEQIAGLRGAQIAAPWTPLNRLKGANAEAFHYWLLAQQILDA